MAVRPIPVERRPCIGPLFFHVAYRRGGAVSVRRLGGVVSVEAGVANDGVDQAVDTIAGQAEGQQGPGSGPGEKVKAT